ncbi:citrate:proton symporter [Hoyosella sp. YIM 151337]|uniref:CitMHS family transporter n=1 Tax=Hoyosella sp. YIM 151337 TaxID=2992742 RepID=UPI0022365ABC|nr:citrate:proton symporter [Hoyosella sp. YIM 151337]MCW4352098.1 citrate:proton symporter [Hoyosella sp. YIM 151337]
MLSLVGLAVIACITTLLILGRISPVVGLTTIPIIGALLAGFTPGEISDFFETGLGSVMDVAVMLVFAIIFFGIMNDVGLFNPLINLTVRLTRGNVVAICVGTVVLAAICHLDGAGASTFLITIPALLPLYKRLDMSPYLLLLLVATSMGIMNMLPWGGPVGRSAAALGLDPVSIWRGLIPVQVISMVLLIGMAVLLGIREKRRIRIRQRMNTKQLAAAGSGGRSGGGSAPGPMEAGDWAAGPANHEQKPRNLWANTLLVFTVMGLLIADIVPPSLAFIVALSVALLINYPKVTDQMQQIRAHGGAALGTGAIILAAACFLGILQESGMLESLASDAVGLLPAATVPYLHLIVGILGLPLELMLSTDAHYFALLPLVESIAAEAGVSTLAVTYTVIVGNVIGTYISPFNASLWLGLGLVGADIGKHIRYSFVPMWAFSVLVLAASLALGAIPFR